MTQPFQIRLPDGSVREVEPRHYARPISPRRSGRALPRRRSRRGSMANCATSCGRSRAMPSLALVTARDEKDALELARHDYAHVLAEAVQNLFPGTQITFGPATDDGFYYDFAPAPGRGPFTEEDLPAIEEEMRAHHRPRRAARPRSVDARRADRDAGETQGETLQGGMGGRAARRRGADHLPRGRAGSTCAAARISPRPASSIRKRSS